MLFSMGSLGVACALLFFGLPCSLFLYNLYIHPLRHFPGPRLWAAFRLQYVRALVRGDLVQRTHELHERYGPVVRIAPDELSFIDAQAWQDIYGFHPGKPNFPKNPLWMQPGDNGIHSILSANDADHSRYRRLLAHAFSERALRQQEELLLGYVELLMGRLRELASSPDTAVVDIVRWFNYTTFDIVGDLSLGESFGCLAESRYHGWVEILFTQFKLASIFVALRFYGLDKMVRKIVPKSMVQKRLEHARIANDRIKNRHDQGASTGAQKPDFMAYILRHNDEKGMSYAEIEATLRTLVVVGSETTGTELSAVVRNLLRHPAELDKVTEEVCQAFSTAAEINAERTSELKYLNAVIDESLRLCPPVALGMPRVVPVGGAEVSGDWLPADVSLDFASLYQAILTAGQTMVSASGFASTRSALNFPDRPSTFDPSRWLKLASEERAAASAFHPFALGPRNCLGKNLAWLEMRLILTHLLWSFDLAVPTGETLGPWEEQKSYILWEKEPLRVQLQVRS